MLNSLVLALQINALRVYDAVFNQPVDKDPLLTSVACPGNNLPKYHLETRRQTPPDTLGWEYQRTRIENAPTLAERQRLAAEWLKGHGLDKTRSNGLPRDFVIGSADSTKPRARTRARTLRELDNDNRIAHFREQFDIQAEQGELSSVTVQ